MLKKRKICSTNNIIFCLAFLISLLLLISCEHISYEEQDHNACLDYGFTLGTQGYTDCRIRLDERRHAEEMEIRRQEHEARLARERSAQETRKIQQTAEAFGSLFSMQQNKQCKKTIHGVKCGRMCLADKWGEYNCGNVCIKDKWGDVKCGISCEKDRWGEVKCGNACGADRWGEVECS